jgi:hypothetical protein
MAYDCRGEQEPAHSCMCLGWEAAAWQLSVDCLGEARNTGGHQSHDNP